MTNVHYCVLLGGTMTNVHCVLPGTMTNVNVHMITVCSPTAQQCIGTGMFTVSCCRIRRQWTELVITPSLSQAAQISRCCSSWFVHVVWPVTRK